MVESSNIIKIHWWSSQMHLLTPASFTVSFAWPGRITQPGQKQMMDHRKQRIHTGDVCIQLYSGICRPFIILGQSLQKHNTNSTNKPPTPIPISCSSSTSLCVLLPQSLLLTYFPSFLSLSQASSFFSFLSPPSSLLPLSSHPLPYSYTPLHRPSSPHSVCLRVENTIIYSFVFPSVHVQTIFTGKIPSCQQGRSASLYGVRFRNPNNVLPVVSLLVAVRSLFIPVCWLVLKKSQVWHKSMRSVSIWARLLLALVGQPGSHIFHVNYCCIINTFHAWSTFRPTTV